MIGMGPTEGKSGQAEKRPMAATSGASLPRDVSVLSIVADLEGRGRLCLSPAFLPHSQSISLL